MRLIRIINGAMLSGNNEKVFNNADYEAVCN